MVEYNIVKFCRICRKRYVVGRRESKKNYCDDCQSKFDKTNSKLNKTKNKTKKEVKK